MAVSVISISLNSSEESLGTYTARFILFGTIPVAIPATIPIVVPPVVHDNKPLIPTETPTIPLVSHSPSNHFSPDDFSSDTSSGLSSGYSPDTSSGCFIPDSSFDSPTASFTGPSQDIYEPYTEPDIDFDVQAHIDTCIAAADAATAREADIRVEVDTLLIERTRMMRRPSLVIEESVECSCGTNQDKEKEENHVLGDTGNE
ncbi:hypothetical protein Tco_0875369 [Tanacetum coccineum]|uniref:Uncharacterized protein n=1 Tax=Tanacetum coccineum TaxID=301880 RepID=A0ABQ5BS83_9ASTR